MEFLPEDKSRTQKKNEDRELQKLGERLLMLNKDQLNAIDITDELKQAVIDTHKIRSNTARQRQIQYIGVLMRDIDPAPLHKKLEYLNSGIPLKPVPKTISRSIKWHEALMSGNDSIMDEILTYNPDIDRQRLRQLARNARKNIKYSGNLLNYLRSVEPDDLT